MRTLAWRSDSDVGPIVVWRAAERRRFLSLDSLRRCLSRAVPPTCQRSEEAPAQHDADVLGAAERARTRRRKERCTARKRRREVEPAAFQAPGSVSVQRLR